MGEDIERWMGEISANLKNLCRDIKEIKEERKEHTEKFWRKIDEITDKLHTQDTEMRVIKGKANIATFIISFIMGIITFCVSIWWKFKE